MTTPTESSARRSGSLVWLSAAMAGVLLTLSVSGTLGSWTQAILRQNTNTVGTAGSVVLSLAGPNSTGAASTCTSASTTANDATCAVNLLGANGVTRTNVGPGDTLTTIFTLSNPGEIAGTTLNIAPGDCTGSTDLCGSMLITLTCVGTATTVIGPMTLTAFGNADRNLVGVVPALGAATSTCTSLVTLPLLAPAATRNKTVTQDVIWTLTA